MRANFYFRDIILPLPLIQKEIIDYIKDILILLMCNFTLNTFKIDLKLKFRSIKNILFRFYISVNIAFNFYDQNIVNRCLAILPSIFIQILMIVVHSLHFAGNFSVIFSREKVAFITVEVYPKWLNCK
jgi:hypothetical protein